MSASSTRSQSEAPPRSDSEIEVDFGRHQTSPAQLEVSSEKNKPLTDDAHKSNPDDTEGSSIIDLRRDDPIGQSFTRQYKNYEYRSPGRRVSDGKNEHEYDAAYDNQINGKLQSDRSKSPLKNEIKELDLNGDTLKRNKGRESFGSRGSKKCRKSFRKNVLADLPDSPPRSPTFSFKSTISLLPSTRDRNGLRQQIIVTTSCSLAPLACGFAMAYSFTKESDLLARSGLGAWSYQAFLFGALFGSLFCGVALNHGRKIPLFLSIVLLLSGWMAIIFASKLWMVFLFNAVSGACTSVVLVISHIYVSEIAFYNVRGALTSAPILAFHIGLLFCFILGEALAWKNLAIAGVSTTIPFFIGVAISMPESPRYLILKQPNEALSTLQWLRGFSTDIMNEYKAIADTCDIDQWGIRKRDIVKPAFWRPLLVSCGLMFLYSMSGANSVFKYGKDLFVDVSGTSSNMSYFIVTAVLIVGIIISSVLVDQVGRKLLLLLSLTIMSATAFALGLFLFLKDLHHVDSYFVYQWAAEVFCVILFTLSYGSAIAPIAWITLGESFSPKLKWVGVSISSLVMWACVLAMDMIYDHLPSVIATGGLFWLHCIVCVGGYIFLLLSFRELKDHKIDDISRVFSKKNVSLIDTFITRI